MGETAAAVAPVLSTLAQTVLGALVVLAMLMAVTAIYMLVRVQNARVADQKEMSDKLEKNYSRSVDAFTRFQNTLENLEKGEAEGTRATYAMRDQVNRLADKIELCPARGK